MKDAIDKARHAGRVILRRPALLAVVVAALAIGLGSLIVAFTLLDAAILRKPAHDFATMAAILDDQLSKPRLAASVVSYLGGAALVIAGLASPMLDRILYDVEPLDPGIYSICAAALLIAALGASAIPALRASRVDPAISLRSE